MTEKVDDIPMKWYNPHTALNVSEVADAAAVVNVL
jgi:hypothetical protein